MDKLRALRYFLRVAETNSFTAAAADFSVPGSSVSRRIRDLENALGVELFHRSTRNVRLTEIGRLYYDQVRPSVHALDHADILVGQQSRTPTGVLRITSIPGYGVLKLIPALEKFRALYPEIIVDLEITDQVADFAKAEIDIAIRSTAQLPDRVVARKISEDRYILVASPAYLAALGTPENLADLSSHKTIQYRGPKGIFQWLARKNENRDDTWQRLDLPVALITNRGESIQNALIAGEGIALLPDWGISDEISTGALCEFKIKDAQLSVSRSGNSAVYLLYFRPKYELQKVRVAVDFLLAELT